MCGINGFLNFNGRTILHPEELISTMNSSIAHRGPDDAGCWVSRGKQVSLGHRRLSIIDLTSAGHQPMTDEAGNGIVFNGEIYNYRQLKELIGTNHHFKSDSDTEILLELYKKEGHQALRHLNGMYAFAYWDENTEALLLARDRAGKKPLYYSEMGGIFSFSSEIKGLLTLPWINAIPDEEAIYHFLTYNQLPPPFTLFKGIKKLAPASHLTVTKTGILEQEYWEIHPENWNSKSEEEVSRNIFTELENAVNYRMISDVPVGAFLSGGVDSSAVVALMRKISGGKIKTYSVGFEGEPDYDERSYAQQVSSIFETEHYEQIIKADDISSCLPAIVDSFDEPMADATCIPIYFISKLAKQHGTIVVQTGDGADELFAGYRSWNKYNKLYPLYHLYNRFPSLVKKGLSGILNETTGEASPIREILARASKNEEFFWGGARAFKESTKRSFLTTDFNQRNTGLNSYSVIESYRRKFEKLRFNYPWLTDLDWMCYLGFKFQIPSKYLYRMDRLGMTNSIEIRNPFLDYHLINAAFSTPSSLKIKNNEPKYILKKSLEELLPKEILYRKKMGLCVPLREWAGEIMLDYTEQNMKSFTQNTGIFNEKGLETQIREIRKGNTAYTNQIWTIYFMMAWFKKWMSA